MYYYYANKYINSAEILITQKQNGQEKAKSIWDLLFTKVTNISVFHTYFKQEGKQYKDIQSFK
jgi:hypothetical protein